MFFECCGIRFGKAKRIVRRECFPLVFRHDEACSQRGGNVKSRKAASLRNIGEEYRQAQRKGARQMKLRRFTSAGVEMARQYLAAVKESNDVENVTLNGQPFTRAAKL